MLAKERQDKIYEILKADGAVETTKLAKLFSVSIETVRKDFIAMEKNGLLTKTHGGAIINGEFKPRYEFIERCEQFSTEKRNLSIKACEFISEGDIIAIDEGSTAIAFAEVLKERFSNLTVITYCIDVFNTLCNHKDFELILCGGNYLKKERFFYGNQTLENLSNLNFNKSFIFPSAVSLESGICGYNVYAQMLQKRLIEASTQTFILADSSKFEKKALLKLSDFEEKFIFITDGSLSEELKKVYKGNNIRIFTGE